ncbi:MAG: DUF6496 domain-containing protein [Pseudomonadota bacterium]
MAQSRGQKRTVARVMRERKHGALKSSSGRKVTSRKQAIAIAMSESGQSRKRPAKRKSSRTGTARVKTHAGQDHTRQGDRGQAQGHAPSGARPQDHPVSPRREIAGLPLIVPGQVVRFFFGTTSPTVTARLITG